MLCLCQPKVKLLKKEINKPEFSPTEKIQVNLAFQNPQLRLNVVPIAVKKKKTGEKTEEDKEAESGITKERQQITEAYIVKVMKTHKTVKHTDLVTKVIAQIANF